METAVLASPEEEGVGSNFALSAKGTFFSSESGKEPVTGGPNHGRARTERSPPCVAQTSKPTVGSQFYCGNGTLGQGLREAKPPSPMEASAAGWRTHRCAP